MGWNANQGTLQMQTTMQKSYAAASEKHDLLHYRIKQLCQWIQHTQMCDGSMGKRRSPHTSSDSFDAAFDLAVVRCPSGIAPDA